MSRKSWILLVLAEADKDGLTPLKLQKTLFLLLKAFPLVLSDFYSFKPYNYGPFDANIYHDADDLVSEGFISKVRTDHTWSKYEITQEGINEIERVTAKEVDSQVKEYITKLVTWIKPLSFQVLVSSIYKNFPEYKINSVFVE